MVRPIVGTQGRGMGRGCSEIGASFQFVLEIIWRSLIEVGLWFDIEANGIFLGMKSERLLFFFCFFFFS